MEGRRQKAEDKTNIYFIMYMIVIVIMAIIYFTVPERKSFFEYQKKWWGEVWEVVRDNN